MSLLKAIWIYYLRVVGGVVCRKCSEVSQKKRKKQGKEKGLAQKVGGGGVLRVLGGF